MSTSNYLKKLEELKARAYGTSGENNSSNESVSSDKGSGSSSQSVLDRIKARADGTDNVTPTISSQGMKGWQKYLDDQEAAKNAPKHDLNNDGKDSWWETFLGYLGGNGGGVVDTTMPTAGVTQTVHDLRADESYRRPNDDWNDSQRAEFGILYLENPSKAYEYAERTNNANNKAKEEAKIKEVQDSATSGFWAGAGHTVGAIASAPLGMADFLSDLAYANAGRDIAPDGQVSPFEYSQAVTGGISEHLNEEVGTLDEDIPIIGGKGLGDVYGLGTSIAQSMASAYTLGPIGTLVSYFGQGAASGVDEALSRGASDEQAMLYGTALGVFEGLAEMVGVDKLFKLGSSSTIKGFIKNILSQAGAEGAEEGLTALCSNIADIFVMQDKSNFVIALNEYMANGMSESDAKWKVFWDSIESIAFDTIAGAISGGVSGSVHTTAQNFASNINAKKTYGDGADLVTEALDIDADNTYAQKMQAKLDKGKNLSGGQINRLVETNEQTLLKQDTAKMKSAVESRLTELGESGDISKLADVIVKAQSGGKLTSAERSALVNSKYGRRVSTELNPKSIESGEYTSSWAENIGTERINEKAYNKDLYDLATKQTGTDLDKRNLSLTKNPTSKEIVTEGKFKASESGKTKIGDTEVSIKEIASIKNGEMMLRLEDDSTVNASDVEYSSNEEGLLYENVVHMGLNAATANAFVNGYDGSMPVAEYALDFRQAYRYGEIGIPKSELSSEGFSSRLTDSQKSLAYDLGSTDAKYKASEKEKIASTSAIKYEKDSQKTSKKGKLHNTLTPTNETQRASLKTLGMLAETLGIDIYTFESPLVNGKRQGANGWYDPTDNSIHIDLYAGNDGKGTMLFTAAHELTHHIREMLPAKFKVFADFLFEQYGEKGVSVSELIEKRIGELEANGRTKGLTDAQIYDRAYEEVVADACESFLADGEAVAKIAELKAKDKTLWQTIKDFLTKLVARIKEAYKGLSPDSIEGRYVAEMLDSAEKLKAMWTEMLVEASEISNIVEIDTNTQSVSPMLSERTWTASEYVTEREKTAKAISKALNVDIKTAYKYIDDINGVARLIADDRARLDYEPNLDEKATVLKPNSDYKYSVDMSTLCAKRLLFTGTFDAIQRALPNMVFDSEDIVSLREMMQKRGYEVACGICYVESTRREIGRITQDFINSYKESQKTGKPMTRINSSGKVVDLKKTNEQKATTVDKSTDKFFAEKDYTPTLADLNTTDIDLVKRDHPLVYEAYLNFMNTRGQAKPKLLETRAEYKGEILKHFKAKNSVEARNNAGGLRLQSFSDFEVPHMIDMMQIVMDMSRVGLMSQAYTKVPAFAEIFGDTGVKINLSLIAKGDGLDSNGNLIFDDVEGINHKEAFKLRDKYSKNVGTILVGKTDAHIIAAMADPRIDYIIPFHKSSWKESLYDALGLTGYADYTDTQNEKPIDKDRKIKNFEPSEYWDFTKSGDENAQIYLEKCREDGRIPKFPQFQGYPGYWKLLIDFKMYDNDGIGSPQEVVRPTFNTEASERILGEYKGGHKSFPVAKDVVEDFVKEHKDKIKYSNRTFSYNELVAKGNLNGKVIQKNQQIRFTADGSIDVDWVVQQVKNKCKQIQTNAKQPTYYIDIPDIGENVEIINNGIKHGFIKFEPKNGKPVPKRSLINARVALELPWLLQNSIEVNRANKSNNANVPYSHILIGTIGLEANDGSIEYYAVRSVVEERINQPPAFVEAEILGRLHASNAKKIGLPRVRNNKSLSQGVTYEYSIAHLVEDVKSEFNDTFSHDVYKKLGMQRKTNDFSNHLLYSERVSYAPTFYSYMGKVIDDIKLAKMGTGGVVSYLKGKGVKNEEIKWSGIEAFLEGKKSVTKAELQEFVAGSQLEIEEATRQDASSFDVQVKQLSQETKALYVDGELVETFTKDNFGEWHPETEPNAIFWDDEDILNRYSKTYYDKGAKWEEYKLDGGTNYREIVFKMPNSSYSNDTMRTHWGHEAKGILAHARIQDMTTADGKNMLFIEEIQSDWHNEGHKKGYGNKDKLREKLDEAEQKTRKAQHEAIRYLLDHAEHGFNRDEYQRLDEISKTLEAEEIRLHKEWYSASDVPEAPFKDNYYEYVLKRLLRMAAEEGYDSIGWTTADIQSKRWSDEYAEGYRIEYDQDIPKFLKKYGKKWGAKVGHSVIEDSIDGRYLYTDKATGEVYTMEEVMTKAEQIVETKYNEPVGMGDIEISITGAVYVETEKHNTYIAMEVSPSMGTKVWSMDITDSMEQSVLYEGQVMYSDRNPDSVSNRSLLANALEGVTQNDIERNKLAQYKAKIALIESEQAKLAEIRAKIKELSFAKGPRDTKAIKQLKFEENQTANRINTYDRQLLNLEATAALKGVLEREKQMAYKKAEQKGREALDAYREKMTKTQRELLTRYKEQRKEQRERATERRDKTTLRRKIRKLVKELNSLFKNGTKKRNIKEEMKGAVASSLALADVLFNDDIKNEDIVRLGVASVTTKESEYLNKYRDLLDVRDSLYAEIESIHANGMVRETMLVEVGKVEEKIEKVNGQIAYLNNKLSDLFERERTRLNKSTVDAIIDELITEYSKLKDSENGYIKNAYSEAMEKRLTAFKEALQGTVAKDMDVYQLQEFYDTFKAIEHMIRCSNSLFREGRTEDLMTYVSNVQGEIYEASTEQKDRSLATEKIVGLLNEFSWNNLRPVDAVERLGSQTFEKLFWDFVHAMGTAARDIVEAGEVIASAREKFGYSEWNMELADTTFTTRDGLKFKPSLADKLSIYAYSQRDQAEDHMVDGGFTYDTGRTYKETKNGKTYVRRKLSNTYRLSKENIQAIIDSLSNEQRGYVNAILPYLTDMGKKGNEVSMTLYGIELFGEKVYFPLQSSRDYLSSTTQTLGATPTMASLANSGFTKQTKPHASNPIVLRGFDDVVLEHIEKMSNYHALVIPIENLRRVFDNVGREMEGMPISTKALIGSRFGVEAQKYFEQWLTDINGGMTPSGAKHPFMKLFSRAKGTAVAANLSVVAQQYFSIIRAMEVVNPKYFTPFLNGDAKKTDMKQYEELLKYAPIAIIKEMGGFDVGSGGRTKDYIGYEGARKDAKYIKKKVDDIWMWGASAMDKLGWVTIWKAVKAEVASEQKLKPGTDEFYEACRVRFTEIVTKTQVFDSVASRSGYMRSQHDAVKYATSFMGEPTAIAGRYFVAGLNLVRAIKSKNGTKIKSAALRLGRVATVVAVSNVLGKLAQSLIYGGRDDDEDEALLERWMRNFGEALAEDFKPYGIAGYLPFGRDLVSLVEGYSVERPEMQLIEDVFMSAKKATDGDLTLDDSLNLVGSVGNLFGQPLKNIIREIKSAINVFGDVFDDIHPTDMGGAFVEGFTGNERSKTEMLYDSIMSGDTERVEVIKASYKTDTAYTSALRTALTENDPRIAEAVMAHYEGDVKKRASLSLEIEKEGNFSQNIVRGAINNEITRLGNKIKAALKAKETDTAEYKKAIKELREMYPKDFVEKMLKDTIVEEEEETEDKVIGLYKMDDYYKSIINGNTSAEDTIFKELVKEKLAEGYLQVEAESWIESSFSTKVKEAYMDGDITRHKATSLLVSHGGKKDSDAETEIKKCDFELNHDISWSERARAYRLGKISKSALISAVMDIEGEEREGAEEYIRFLELEMDNPTIDITASDATSYFKYAEPAGISIDVYVDYKEQTKGLESDKDANGNSISGSKKAKIMSIINSLPISSSQKDALYFAEDWAASKLYEAPWH